MDGITKGLTDWGGRYAGCLWHDAQLLTSRESESEVVEEWTMCELLSRNVHIRTEVLQNEAKRSSSNFWKLCLYDLNPTGPSPKAWLGRMIWSQPNKELKN